MNLVEAKSIYLTTVKFEANTSFNIFSELSTKIHKNNYVNIDVLLLIPTHNIVKKDIVRFECFYNSERFQKDFHVSDFLKLNNANDFFDDNELKMFYPTINELNNVKESISIFYKNRYKFTFNSYVSIIS